MGKFEDYIRSINPDTPLPDGLLSNLQAAYAEDIALSEAKIASVESAIADKDANIASLNTELTQAKSHNYDLLMQVPQTVNQDLPPAGDSDKLITVDSLFGDNNGS